MNEPAKPRAVAKAAQAVDRRFSQVWLRARRPRAPCTKFSPPSCHEPKVERNVNESVLRRESREVPL